MVPRNWAVNWHNCFLVSIRNRKNKQGDPLHSPTGETLGLLDFGMTRRFVDDVRRNSIQVRTQFIVRRESENIFTGRRGINPAIVEDCIRRHD